MSDEGRMTIYVFITYGNKDCYRLERYLHRRDVGCFKITYEEAGLTYLVSQFTDPHLLSNIPRGLVVEFGDLTEKVKDVREARAYVARQRDVSRRQMAWMRREIIKKTNGMVLKGEVVEF